MYREQRKRRPIENQFFTQFSIFWNALDSVGSKEFCSSKIGHHNAYARSVRGRAGIARHSPGVKQLTRRNCPLLNCESVLWGIEADGQRPRGSRAPQRSETKISSPRAVEAAICMTRNGLIATCFVCLLIAGTGRAHGLDPSKRLTQYRHNVWPVQDAFFPSYPIWVSQNSRRLSVGGNVEWRRPL